MKIIKHIEIDGIIIPSEPLPVDAKLIVFNGKGYVIYEDGDKLPDE